MQTFPPAVATGTPDAGEPLTCVICLTEVNPAAESVDCGDGPEHVGCHESNDSHADKPATDVMTAVFGDVVCLVCGADVGDVVASGAPRETVVVQLDCGHSGPYVVGETVPTPPAPAVTPWVRRTPDLAGVLAAGVAPTDEDMAKARQRMAAAVDVTAVMCLESGSAGALGATLAGAVRNGDAETVAYGIRTLLALQAAGSERVDALLAALGGATAGGTGDGAA